MKSKRNFTARWIIAGMLIAILSGAYIPVNGATIDAIVGPFTFTVTTKACFFAGGFSGTTVTIDGVDVQPGDVVGAFVDADPTDDSVNDLCIGAIAVTNAGVYPLLNAYGDDPGGDKDGADDGETVHFKIWDASEDRILYGDTSDNTVWEENQSKNVGLAATSGISADGTGTAKDSFVGEDIYGKAVLGLIAQTTYPIFVMADNASWSNGDPLTHMVGPAQSFSTDAFGHMDTTLLWADPTPGNYDIIVDVDADGFYNPEIDYLDDNGQIGFTTRWPTITVTVGPNGTVEHPPGGPLTSPAVVSIEPGTSPVFTITPDACHYVDIVSVDGQPLVGLAAIPPAGGTYTFTAVTDDHTLGAYFDEYYYTIATSATPPEGGTITPASPITVYCGNPQTITITPATCYEIGTVEICGPEWLIEELTGTSAACAYVTATIDGNGVGTLELPAVNSFAENAQAVTLEVTFSLLGPYFVSATPTAADPPAGGIITASVDSVPFDLTGENMLPCGTLLDVTVTPDVCYEIIGVWITVGWQGTPEEVTSPTLSIDANGVGTFTHEVLDNVYITATFGTKTVRLTGTISAGRGTIFHGTAQELASTVSTDPPVSGQLDLGCPATDALTASAVDCYYISRLEVNGAEIPAAAGEEQYSYLFEGVTSDQTFEVWFAQYEYTITSLAPGTGNGGGIEPPAGVGGVGGDVTVLCGENQSFDITPDPCWEIAQVTVDGAPVDASEYPETSTGSGIYRYTFTNVLDDHAISATFTQISYEIAYSVTSGNGTIAPDDSAPPNPISVLCGEDKVFYIEPAPCWEIAEVAVDGTPVDASEYPETPTGSGIYRYTFTDVQANHEISVTFTQIIYNIAYFVTSGSGAIVPDGSTSPSPVSVLCGEDQAFDITPDPCWQIAEVTVDGTPADASEYPETSTGSAVYRYTFTNVQADHAISVTFTQITYEIAYSVTSGSGAIAPDGSTSPSPVSVLCGEDQAFNITPDPCWEIAEVIVDGTPVEASSGIYTFTDVQANHEISVTFTQITYEIAYSVTSGNGTIVPDGSTSPSPVSVLCGEDQAFNMTPDSCWEIAEVTVDGTPAEASGGVYTFTDVQADHEISVTFTLIPYTLTLRVKDATGGSINGPTSGLIRDEGPEIVDCGDKPTITMTPDDNMRVKRLVVCGVTVIEDPDPPVTEYVFVEPVISDYDVEVTFEPDVHIIVSEAPGYTNGGGIIPVFDDGTGGETEVSHGSSQAFDITPDPCWEIAEVTVDGTPVNASEYPETSPGSGVYRYIFTDVQVDHEIFVTFTQITYEITHWVAGGDGTIEPVGSVPGSSSVDNGNVFSMTVLCGTENPFDMTPDPCWEMGEVAVDGTPVDASEYPETPTGSGVYRYTFANVQSDRTISVTFTRIVHTVTTVAPGEGNGGAIVPPMEVGGIGGAVAVLCGDDQMFTMTPDAKYYLDDVVLDEVSVMSQVQVDSEMGIGVYTLENVRADHTLEAIFELSPLRLLSASYEVCETLLTLVFDQPIDPASALFNRIDMEIEDSGNLDFGLGDIERCLVAIPGIPVDGGYPVMINILCEVPAVATLGIAAFITHKDKDIDLILAPGAFTAQNGATNGVEDVPLKITVDGRVLTRRGDLSGDGVISAYDAGLLLQFRVFGPRVLPVYDTVMELGSWLETFGHADAEIDIIQYLADTDGRVGVTANDAAEILKLCAGLIPAFPACDSCAPVADMTHRNGRLVANSLDDQRLEVSIDLDDVRDVNSADIVLTYNPQALTVADVSGTDAVSDWLAVHGTTAPGQLRIALAGAEQPVKNGSLVTVSFDVASSDAIKQLDLTELRLNGLKATVQNLPKAFALMQNYPNPFNPETWIPYKLSESADVTVTIYNTVGQVVKQLELGNRMPGEYVSKSRAVYWNGENEWGERVSSGIYFYQLQAGRDASVKKMIIAK